jgi:hypothetical protein
VGDSGFGWIFVQPIAAVPSAIGAVTGRSSGSSMRLQKTAEIYLALPPKQLAIGETGDQIMSARYSFQ